MVGDGDGAVGVAVVPAEVVPSPPQRAVARHQAGVGVQQGVVLLILQVPQHGAFGLGRLRAEDLQRLIAVAGENDVVEQVFEALGRLQSHRMRPALDFHHRRAGPHPARAQGLHDAVDVFAGAAVDRVPLHRQPVLHQAVVLEKAQERGERKVAEALGARRPDRGGGGQQEVFGKGRIEVMGVEEVADGQGRVDPVAVHLVADIDEPDRLPHHLPVARAHPVSGPGQQVAAGELALTIGNRDREVHVGELGLHPQFVEQPHEVGVVDVVEDDEARVHRPGPVAQIDIDGIAVAAQPAVGLEQGNIRRLAQGVSSGQAGNTGTNDRNFVSHAAWASFSTICSGVLASSGAPLMLAKAASARARAAAWSTIGSG